MRLKKRALHHKKMIERALWRSKVRERNERDSALEEERGEEGLSPRKEKSGTSIMLSTYPTMHYDEWMSYKILIGKWLREGKQVISFL